MSKGSNQRPSKVPKKQFDENWDNIFGKKEKFYFSVEEDEVHHHFEEIEVTVVKNEKK
jgi:hypothetical protein